MKKLIPPAVSCQLHCFCHLECYFFSLWQIDIDCSDRSFAYRMLEELHHPWLKRLFLGFARTSEFNGPAMPNGSPHHLIQEIDVELPVAQPILHLTHQIFGSCPPMQNFDPAKLLTVHHKLTHTLSAPPPTLSFAVWSVTKPLSSLSALEFLGAV